VQTTTQIPDTEPKAEGPSTSLRNAHTCVLIKIKRSCIALNGTASYSYGVSLTRWDHMVIPSTWHKWTNPTLTPARLGGTWIIAVCGKFDAVHCGI